MQKVYRSFIRQIGGSVMVHRLFSLILPMYIVKQFSWQEQGDSKSTPIREGTYYRIENNLT